MHPGDIADNVTPWSNKLCLELALGLDDTVVVLSKHGVSPQQYDEWCRHPLFTRTIAEYQQQARDSGMSFKLRARIQAEDMLNVSYKLVHNQDVPAAVRADLIKWTAKMAELEPNQKDAAANEQVTTRTMQSLLEKMEDGDLEVRVMQILSKKNTNSEKIVEGEVLPKRITK